jgi:hypothetical protein
VVLVEEEAAVVQLLVQVAMDVFYFFIRRDI